MHYLFGGLALLVFLIFAARTFVKANPKQLAQTMRSIGGWGLIVASGLLALRGLFPIALPMAAMGAMLLGKGSPFAGGFGPFRGNANKSRAQTSKVSTAHLEMTLDHDSGDMDGRIINGPGEGIGLGELDREALIELHTNYRANDPQSAQLLAAYLDRSHEGWRDQAGMGDGDAPGADARNDAMTPEEALEVLGLEEGASSEDIASAHRNLMKRMHPDQGGSTYLAAKINQAKDVLLQKSAI
jgi:hypothetical protein